jgi:hypothetical protein
VGMLKSIFLFIFYLLGLFGFGVIVAEVLKKWHIISQSASSLCIIVPIWTLYIIKQATRSSTWKDKLHLSPRTIHRLNTIINVILIILGLMALISLPFLWYGIIEELAAQKR